MKNLLILIVILGVIVAGYFGYKKFYPSPKETACTLEAKVCPDGTSVGRTGPNCEFAPCPSAKSVSQNGTVTGRLCFPSSFLPPGEVAAKDITSGKIYTQNYVGSLSGGKMTYTIELPVGTYHLRYQAHGSTTKPDIFTSGYFDECAKTMHTDQCTPDSGHIMIDVTVKANEETKNVNLCDFYYNPTQMDSLDAAF